MGLKKGQTNSGSFKKGQVPYNKGLKGYHHSGTFKKGHKGFISKEKYKEMGEKRKGVSYISEDGRKRISLKNSENMKLLWKDKNYRKKTKAKLWEKGYQPWNKGMKNFLGGEKHYNWQGGKSFEPYDKSFNNQFKRAIRKRDNQICRLCGIHREKLKKALSIHHINYDKKLTIPQNCISLCNKCHTKTNFNREQWIKFFQGLLNEKYGYEYNETGEVILKVIKNGEV